METIPSGDSPKQDSTWILETTRLALPLLRCPRRHEEETSGHNTTLPYLCQVPPGNPLPAPAP